MFNSPGPLYKLTCPLKLVLPTNLHSHHSLTNNPIEDKLGVHMIRRIWDPVDQVETETYHDINGEHIDILYGFCEVHYHHDDNDQLHSVYCYNGEGETVDEPEPV